MRRIQSIFFLLFMVMMTTQVASAAIIDVPFGVVNVAGANYYLNFTYDDGASAQHTFNNLNPTITFTTQTTAEAARLAITAMYLPNELPNTEPPRFLTGFLIPYEADATYFSHVLARDWHGNNEWDPPWDFEHHTGIGRDDGVTFTFAEFSPVPLPSAVWLLGSGIIGIVGIRRKFKQ